MRLRAVLTVTVTAIAVGALMLVTGAFGQGSSVGSLALQPGVNMGVSCPNPLSNANVQPNSLTLQCADNPNTTNSSTTTTVPATTTTVPATTTTAAATTTTTVPATTTPPSSGACGLAQPAFCETFDQPTTNPANSRSGQLNGTLWGTSVESGGYGNAVAAVQPGAIDDGTQSTACSSNATVNYPQNIQICNGALQDTNNDDTLAMYPKQPFDFAGRTGTIVFDVSNNTEGNHAAWPELWVTDQPVPVPFAHEASWQSLPRNGFGIRFAGCAGICSAPSPAAGVDSAITVNNYVENDSFNGGDLDVQEGSPNSVTLSQPGQMNHYEVQVSQSLITVYGSDAFSGTWNPSADPLVQLATIPVNLGFTRGLVWLEDVHYNADKFGNQATNTFTWDNVGFDGPVLPRDLAFDAPDNTVPDNDVNASGRSGIDTAWIVAPNSSMNLTVPGVTGVAQASGALLTFNFYPEGVAPITLNVAVNGHAISVPWPYPDNSGGTPRTIAIPVPLADVTAGNNTVTFSAGNYNLDVMNVDLIMQGAGGIVL